MNTVNLAITYRPVRVGWCVKLGNRDDLRRALRWSCTLWGGRYNPIIPVDKEVNGKALASLFRVDVLYPVERDAALTAFVDSLSHLRWTPFPGNGDFFQDYGSGKEAPFLDISSSVRDVYEKYVKGLPPQTTNATYFTWEAGDALADVFQAQFGSYPPPDEAGFDYFRFTQQILGAREVPIEVNGTVPPDAFERLTPSQVTNTQLVRDSTEKDDGFYVGQAENFEDIVNFWNLRAADLELFFFDPAHATRLAALRSQYVGAIQSDGNSSRRSPRPVAVWSRAGFPFQLNGDFGNPVLGGEVHKYLIPFTPPLMHSVPRSVLASLSDYRGRSLVTFQLPEGPFRPDAEPFGRHIVVGVRASQFGAADLGQTFGTPFLPELNDFYRRQMLVGQDAFRVQRDGFGVIVPANTSDLSFFALQAEELIVKFFDLFGIKAKPSAPGRIARRTIQQMGGLQGCRVFKLPGVRDLIDKYGPLKSFTRGAATKIISRSSPDGKLLDFPTLFIDGAKLTPSSTFDYLLARGVFRVGLELACPNCNLEFWAPLETLGHDVVCEYCGEKFNVAPQLKDRDWRFRRSGLFGRDNHQEGAIPVCLTLQQLESNVLNMHGFRIFGTSFELSSAGAGIPTCETDLVLLMQNLAGQIELAIGECKSAGPKSKVTEEDARNLGAVANVFPAERIAAFVIFSKTASFSEDEVTNCQLAQPAYSRRAIMFSDRELEPYHVFERTAKEFEIRPTAISLDHLARETPSIYFQPRPKK